MKLFPIRHHGPGSAFALLEGLQRYRPDIVLIEGAADATPYLHWLSHAEMEPPVGLLSYRPDKPGRSTVSPFAVFSPEYNGIRYAHDHGVPVRFFDIPYGHLLSLDHGIQGPPSGPFQLLGRATGTGDFEAWWNLFVEQRRDTTDLFKALLELVVEMRSDLPEPKLDHLEEKQREQVEAQMLLSERREAYMRQEIRRARREGFSRIVCIIGAWHAPALLEAGLDQREADDREMLTDLSLVPIEHTWIPWTYGRLSTLMGYRAGIKSPGWYHHLWQMKHEGRPPTDVAIGWLMQVAQLLREEDLDASAAHVIESVRLAEALAGVRNLPLPGLPELNDAAQTVMCGGRAEPLRLVERNLIVGERMGDVPSEIPLTPLQRDLRSEQKRLKLRPSPDKSTLKLDLRLPAHKERSTLLHRLGLLDIHWGVATRARGLKQGTYTEVWQLMWRPDFEIKVMTASMWGNTVLAATEARVGDLAERAGALKQLTELLDHMILADLPDTLQVILNKIEEQVSLSSDVLHMFQAVPPLARIMRYGDVRQTDQTMIKRMVDSLLTRACIGLPTTCAAVDDKAAQEIYETLAAIQPIMSLVESTDVVDLWYQTLLQLVDGPTVHGLLSGSACRYLFHARVLSSEETADRMGRVLSLTNITGKNSAQLIEITAWIDGFLRGAELILVHDDALWSLLDRWILRLAPEHFDFILPLLRRTFATFSDSARGQLQRRAKGMVAVSAQANVDERLERYDSELADQVLPYLERILMLDAQ